MSKLSTFVLVGAGDAAAALGVFSAVAIIFVLDKNEVELRIQGRPGCTPLPALVFRPAAEPLRQSGGLALVGQIAGLALGQN